MLVLLALLSVVTWAGTSMATAGNRYSHTYDRIPLAFAPVPGRLLIWDDLVVH